MTATPREPTSWGLFSWLVPARTDLALHDFVESSSIHLGAASGDLLKWQVCGDQRQADSVYESQRSDEQAAIDEEEGQRFEQQARSIGGREFLIRRLYEESITANALEGIPRSSIVLYGNPDIGLVHFHVPPGALASHQGREKTLDLLCDVFSKGSLEQLTRGHGFTTATMDELRVICLNLENSLALLGPSLGESVEHDATSRRPAKPPYVRVFTNGNEFQFTKDQYEAWQVSRHSMDLFIDGRSGAGIIELGSNGPSGQKLSAAELRLLTNLISAEQPALIAKVAPENHQSAEAAKAMLKQVKKKLRIAGSKDELIQTVPGPTSARTRYCFAPHTDTTYAIVELVDDPE